MEPNDTSRGAADLGSKLDALIRLTAVSILGERTGGEAIDVLARAGLSNDLIAELVGTSPGSVRARRSSTSRKVGSSK